MDVNNNIAYKTPPKPDNNIIDNTSVGCSDAIPTGIDTARSNMSQASQPSRASSSATVMSEALSMSILEELDLKFGAAKNKAQILHSLEHCNVLHRIPVSSPQVSTEQALKDFRRERVLLNEVPFIPDRVDQDRCHAFAFTLKLLLQRLYARLPPQVMTDCALFPQHGKELDDLENRGDSSSRKSGGSLRTRALNSENTVATAKHTPPIHSEAESTSEPSSTAVASSEAAKHASSKSTEHIANSKPLENSSALQSSQNNIGGDFSSSAFIEQSNYSDFSKERQGGSSLTTTADDEGGSSSAVAKLNQVDPLLSDPACNVLAMISSTVTSGEHTPPLSGKGHSFRHSHRYVELTNDNQLAPDVRKYATVDEMTDKILQRACRTSAGADSFFMVQKLLCVEGTFVTQRTFLNDPPIKLDVFIAHGNKEACSQQEKSNLKNYSTDTTPGNSLGSRRVFFSLAKRRALSSPDQLQARSGDSHSVPYDRTADSPELVSSEKSRNGKFISRMNEISIDRTQCSPNSLDSPFHKNSISYTSDEVIRENANAKMHAYDSFPICGKGPKNETDLSTDDSQQKACNPAKVENEQTNDPRIDAGSKIKQKIGNRGAGSRIKALLSPSKRGKKGSNSQHQQVQDKEINVNKERGASESSSKSGASSNRTNAPAICARIQVRNSFAVYDVAAIEEVTGDPSIDPDPWLEVEAVVVDESNFLTGKHWRKLQLIVTCTATGKVYTSSNASAPDGTDQRASGRLSGRMILQELTSWFSSPSPTPQQQQTGAVGSSIVTTGNGNNSNGIGYRYTTGSTSSAVINPDSLPPGMQFYHPYYHPHPIISNRPQQNNILQTPPQNLNRQFYNDSQTAQQQKDNNEDSTASYHACMSSDVSSVSVGKSIRNENSAAGNLANNTCVDSLPKDEHQHYSSNASAVHTIDHEEASTPSIESNLKNTEISIKQENVRNSDDRNSDDRNNSSFEEKSDNTDEANQLVEIGELSIRPSLTKSVSRVAAAVAAIESQSSKKELSLGPKTP